MLPVPCLTPCSSSLGALGLAETWAVRADVFLFLAVRNATKALMSQREARPWQSARCLALVSAWFSVLLVLALSPATRLRNPGLEKNSTEIFLALAASTTQRVAAAVGHPGCDCDPRLPAVAASLCSAVAEQPSFTRYADAPHANLVPNL
jgi:hypothetical protein